MRRRHASLSDIATVHLIYHYEDESWWADSFDVPSLFAGGDSLADAKQLARQVVEAEIGPDTIIMEWVPLPDSMASVTTRAATRSDSERPAVFDDWADAEIADWEPQWSIPQKQLT